MKSAPEPLPVRRLHRRYGDQAGSNGNGARLQRNHQAGCDGRPRHRAKFPPTRLPRRPTTGGSCASTSRDYRSFAAGDRDQPHRSRALPDRSRFSRFRRRRGGKFLPTPSVEAVFPTEGSLEAGRSDGAEAEARRTGRRPDSPLSRRSVCLGRRPGRRMRNAAPHPSPTALRHRVERRRRGQLGATARFHG